MSAAAAEPFSSHPGSVQLRNEKGEVACSMKVELTDKDRPAGGVGDDVGPGEATAAYFAQRHFLGFWGAGLATLLGACQSTDGPATPPLAGLPAAYRPLDRTDTLGAYWAPDSVRAATGFAFTRQHLHRVVVQAGVLTATAQQRTQCDTLRFRPCGVAQGAEAQAGIRYGWEFDYRVATGIALDTTAAGIPTRVERPLTSQLLLYEYVQRGPPEKAAGWYDYTREYPFQPVALARANDSVVYVRAYPVRRNVPQAAAYYTYAYRPNGARDSVYVPHYADRIDSTRLVTVRFRLHQLPPLPPPH